jgi:hypothetical protein
MSRVSGSRAVTVDTPAGVLLVAIGQDAEPASVPTCHVPFDVCPTWLELAIRHLSDAQVAQGARIETWKDADEHSKTGALEWEFGASIQAIMASSIAVDALYAVVQTRAAWVRLWQKYSGSAIWPSILPPGRTLRFCILSSASASSGDLPISGARMLY